MINGKALKGENGFITYVHSIAKRRRFLRYELEYKRLNKYISYLESNQQIMVKPLYYTAFCKYLIKNVSKIEIGSFPLYWILKQSEYHKTDISGLKLNFQFSKLHNDSYYYMTMDESEKEKIPFNFISVLICNYFYYHHSALKNYVGIAKKNKG